MGRCSLSLHAQTFFGQVDDQVFDQVCMCHHSVAAPMDAVRDALGVMKLDSDDGTSPLP